MGMMATTHFEGWLEIHTDSDDDIYDTYKAVEKAAKHRKTIESGRYQASITDNKLNLAEAGSAQDALILSLPDGCESFLVYLDKLYIQDGGVKTAYKLRHPAG